MQDEHAEIILIFQSIHHVLAAEKELKTGGVWHDIIPVPRDISSDCQMAIRLLKKDAQTVRGLIRSKHLQVIATYSKMDGKQRPIDLGVV